MEMVLFNTYANTFSSTSGNEYSLTQNEQIIVSSLNKLTNDYHLRKPIPVRIRWSSQARCYVAHDDTFDWYGTGQTQQEALSELGSIILEDYLDLQRWTGKLIPELHSKLQRMKEMIIHASKS